MVHAQAYGRLAQSFSAGGEEPAEEAAFAEFFDAGPPALGAAAQAVEDAGEFGRDGGLAVAEETAGVIDEEQVASESDQNVQVIIQHREPADGDGEDLCKFFEALFDPLLAVECSFGQQEARRTQRVMQ